MRKISILLIIILTLSFAIQGETVERIVAKVGREVILQSELDKRYQQMIASGLSEENFTLESVLDEMIESELILIKAKESDIEIDEYTIKKMAEQELESLKLQFENELEFRKQLKQEAGLTVTELKDYYQDLIKDQKLRDSVISQEITSQVHVTDAEVEEFYQENLADIPIKEASDRIGMILLKIEASKETRDELQHQLYEIKDKLNKGGDFAELAKEYSDDASAPGGGYLGWIERGLTVKPFEDAAYKLEVGEISDIVETQFGYHLILMQGKKEDQLEISHILKTLEASPEDKASIVTLADEIHDRIINGEDFSKLAQEYSQDDSSAVNGGIIGEFPSDKYPELFSSYLQKLDYGEITDVIEEGDNLYIFGKLAEVEARPYTYEELYDQLKDQVFGKKQMELYDQFIENLKKTTYIEIYL